MKIVIAPDSFKESAGAVAVAEAIARGIVRALPDAAIDACPMADGGEGTVSAMVAATGGASRTVSVVGPLGEPVQAEFGLLDGGRTAVIEMAAASGLHLVPPDRRDPTRTTTFGTGQLIAEALKLDVGRVIVGIGGSATNDGGGGMAQALGYRFFDDSGRLLDDPLAGGRLGDVARIDSAGVNERLAAADVVAACDVDNPLTGPNGAAHIYGPQKGATPAMVEQLDVNLAHWAEVIRRDLGVAVRDLPGAGAAGGLGGGLVAFCGAKLQPGIELVIEATKLAGRVAGADLVITGEGRLDGQSMSGKTAVGVARLARRAGVPCIAIVGSLGDGAEKTREVLDAYHAIKPDDMPLSEAIARVEELLERTAERVMRERTETR